MKLPIWIRLPKLQLNCWGSDLLSRIISLVGVPLCADECTIKQLRFSHARLQVKVDATKRVLAYVPLVNADCILFNKLLKLNGFHCIPRNVNWLVTCVRRRKSRWYKNGC